MKEQSDPGSIDACELRTGCGINMQRAGGISKTYLSRNNESCGYKEPPALFPVSQLLHPITLPVPVGASSSPCLAL